MAPRLLIPFTLPEASPISRRLVKALSGMDVVLLGHYRLPEQTPPEAARDQFQDEALDQLEALAADFEETGVHVETRLLFGQNLKKAIDQVADEEDCGGVLDPAPVKEIERVFVPVLDTGSIDRLVEFVHALTDGSVTVHLGTVVPDGGTVMESEEMLEAARDKFSSAGVDPDTIDTEVSDREDRDAAIVEMASGHDVIVMNEPDPSAAEWILGTLPERIAHEAVLPIVMVRRQV